MKDFRKFFIRHWDKFAIFALSLILFFVVFVPFIVFNSLDKYDTPGLLSLSWFIRDHTFPDFQGWNPYFFAGFPQGILYPPLFHYVVAIVGKVVSIDLAYKLVVSIAGLAIPWAVYRFNRVVYKEKSWSLLSTLFVLIALVALPGYLGFNFDGLIDYGLGPSFVTIPMFFLYLERLFDNKRCFIGPAVIFSLMLLTNLVAPVFALLITAAYLLCRVRSGKILRKILFEGVLILLLILFWAVPFILYQEYAVSGVPIQGGRVMSFIAAAGVTFMFCFVLIFVRKFKQGKVFISILLPGVIFAVLSVIDSIANSSGTKFAIPAVHPFRLLIFTFLGAAISLTFLIQKGHPLFLKTVAKLKLSKLFVRPVHITLVLSLSAFGLISLVFIRLEPRGVESIRFGNHFNWDGRVMRAYKVTEVLDQSRAVIDRSILYNAGNIHEENYYNFGVDGLLKESSYLAPYYQSLSKNLDPENFNWDSLDSYYLENSQVSEGKIEQFLDLLWVKNLFVIRGDHPSCSDNKLLITTFSSDSKEEGVVQRDMYLCAIAGLDDSKMVEPLTSKIITSNNWKEDIPGWWSGSEEYLFIEGNNGLVELSEKDNDLKIDYSFDTDFQEITIGSDSSSPVPILIKMSYFPMWKAYSKGEEIPIFRVSPNFMAINLEGEATLKYERTSVEHITFIVSGLVWAITLGYVVYAKTKRIKTQL
ncbi:MAG: hypothetical protein PHS44_02140 [Candidatus Dojkabacteria bacterium]|nr:hypothetical protein [Candidatus Dojkabacteria bacterium]